MAWMFVSWSGGEVNVGGEDDGEEVEGMLKDIYGCDRVVGTMYCPWQTIKEMETIALLCLMCFSI